MGITIIEQQNESTNDLTNLLDRPLPDDIDIILYKTAFDDGYHVFKGFARTTINRIGPEDAFWKINSQLFDKRTRFSYMILHTFNEGTFTPEFLRKYFKGLTKEDKKLFIETLLFTKTSFYNHENDIVPFLIDILKEYELDSKKRYKFMLRLLINSLEFKGRNGIDKTATTDILYKPLDNHRFSPSIATYVLLKSLIWMYGIDVMEHLYEDLATINANVATVFKESMRQFSSQMSKVFKIKGDELNGDIFMPTSIAIGQQIADTDEMYILTKELLKLGDSINSPFKRTLFTRFVEKYSDHAYYLMIMPYLVFTYKERLKGNLSYSGTRMMQLIYLYPYNMEQHIYSGQSILAPSYYKEIMSLRSTIDLVSSMPPLIRKRFAGLDLLGKFSEIKGGEELSTVFTPLPYKHSLFVPDGKRLSEEGTRYPLAERFKRFFGKIDANIATTVMYIYEMVYSSSPNSEEVRKSTEIAVERIIELIKQLDEGGDVGEIRDRFYLTLMNPTVDFVQMDKEELDKYRNGILKFFITYIHSRETLKNNMLFFVYLSLAAIAHKPFEVLRNLPDHMDQFENALSQVIDSNEFYDELYKLQLFVILKLQRYKIMLNHDGEEVVHFPSISKDTIFKEQEDLYQIKGTINHPDLRYLSGIYSPMQITEDDLKKAGLFSKGLWDIEDGATAIGLLSWLNYKYANRFAIHAPKSKEAELAMKLRVLHTHYASGSPLPISETIMLSYPIELSTHILKTLHFPVNNPWLIYLPGGHLLADDEPQEFAQLLRGLADSEFMNVKGLSALLSDRFYFYVKGKLFLPKTFIKATTGQAENDSIISRKIKQLFDNASDDKNTDDEDLDILV